MEDRLTDPDDDDDRSWATAAELLVALLAFLSVVAFAFWPLLRPLLRPLLWR